MRFQIGGLCFTDARGIAFHHDLGLIPPHSDFDSLATFG